MTEPNSFQVNYQTDRLTLDENECKVPLQNFSAQIKSLRKFYFLNDFAMHFFRHLYLLEIE